MAKKQLHSIQDAGTGQSIADLLGKTYGDHPLGYEGVFKNAYENLNQPYSPTTPTFTPGQSGFKDQPSGQQNVASAGTKEIADAFINRYYQNYGALPDENVIKDFVASKADSRFAQNYITGNYSRDAFNVQDIDPYLKINAADVAPEGTEAAADTTLQDQLNNYYSQARTGLASQVEDAYLPSKQKMVEDQAAQGILSSPVSRYGLNQLEGDKNRSLTQAYGKLAESQAQGQLGVADSMAKLGENARQFDVGQQFNQQSLREQMNQYDTNMGFNRQQLALAGQLGRSQASDSESGLGGDIFSGGASGALLGAKFGGPWGALAGGLAGAGLGAATSKRKKF